MSADALKDPHGRPVQSYPSTRVKTGVSDLLEAVARHGAVALTKHGKPKAFVLSIDEYQALVERRPNPLDALDAEFDEVFEQMQGPHADEGADRLLNIDPAELADKAVKGAAKRD